MMVLSLLTLALFAGGDPGIANDDLIVAAKQLHVGNGEVVSDALVTISGGRIRSVTTGAPPDGALYIDGAHLTPGLVDAFSHMGVGRDTVDTSSESTPAHKLAHTVDLSAPAFQRALEEGVTTAFLSPDSMNVFGGLGAIVKTHGGQSGNLFEDEGSAAKVLHDGPALKISVASEVAAGNSPPRFGPPRSRFTRRPTTRMGSVWVIRRDFHRAKQYSAALADGSAERDADLDVLVSVMNGELPIRVHARRSHDVQTALRLQEEFGWKNLVIEEGTEAFMVAELLGESETPVILGPAYDTLSRAIAAGPSVADFRNFAKPRQICCEHLGPEELGDHYHEDENGHVAVSDFALDLLSLTLPRYTATGYSRGRNSEGDKSTPACAALLNDAGVPCALGAAEAHDAPNTEASVIHQARTAAGYGLAPERALAMATSEAAELCFADERVGTVETGKDADLVLWSGPPLDASSKPLIVIVDGVVALDRRTAATPD